MALDINVEYFCIYTKWIRQISYQESNLTERPLSQNCKLPTSCWHHTVLHTVNLIQIHITAIKMVPPRCSKYVESWPQPNISHLRVGFITHTDITTVAYIHGH